MSGVLQDGSYGTQIISKWKSLLENDQLLSHSSQDLSSDAFHRCQAPPTVAPPPQGPSHYSPSSS